MSADETPGGEGSGDRREPAPGSRDRRAEQGSITSPGGVPLWLDRSAAIGWRLLVVIAAVLVVAYLLRELQLVVVPVLLALALTTVLSPPAHWLQRRGFPPAAATATVFVVVIGGFLGLVALFGVRLQAEFADLGDDLERAWEDIREWLVEGPFELSEREIDRYIDQAGTWFGENIEGIGSQALVGAQVVMEILAAVLLALVLTFFLVKDSGRISGWASATLPTRHQAAGRAVALRAWHTTGAYLRGTAIVGFVDALFIGIGLWIIGVPLVLPLAIITWFAAFFPIVGATTAGLLAALVALVSGGVVDMLLVLGLVILVQQTEGNVLEPVVLGRVLRLHAVVILLALTAGAIVAGILGALLAVPLTAVAVASVDEWRSQTDHQRAPPKGSEGGISPRGPPTDD